ncbi:hypothetical protein V8E55_005994 [Tylopilus felleus]
MSMSCGTHLVFPKPYVRPLLGRSLWWRMDVHVPTMPEMHLERNVNASPELEKPVPNPRGPAFEWRWIRSSDNTYAVIRITYPGTTGGLIQLDDVRGLQVRVGYNFEMQSRVGQDKVWMDRGLRGSGLEMAPTLMCERVDGPFVLQCALDPMGSLSMIDEEALLKDRQTNVVFLRCAAGVDEDDRANHGSEQVQQGVVQTSRKQVVTSPIVTFTSCVKHAVTNGPADALESVWYASGLKMVRTISGGARHATLLDGSGRSRLMKTACCKLPHGAANVPFTFCKETKIKKSKTVLIEVAYLKCRP